jgi:hypothetical protein
MFKFPRVIRRQHEGPLGIHIDAYEALLGEQGYSRGSMYVHLHIVADLSRWLKRRQLDVDDVDDRTVERYLRSRRRLVDGYRGASSIPYKFLGMLRHQGIVNHKSMPVAADACEVAITNFNQYLSQERGLSVSIQCNYTRFAQQFLRERFGRGSVQFSRLSATDVTEFVRRHAHEVSARSAQHMVGALRAFLRYLRYQGEIATDLAACVPRVANWSYSACPGSCSQDKYSKCWITAIGAVPWAYGTMRSCCCWRGWVCGRAK